MSDTHTASSQLPWRRVPSQSLFENTDNQMLGAVQVQRSDRGPPYGGDAVQAAAHPAEMKIPRMLPWMKQPRGATALRVTRSLARALAQRTMNAGQRQIFQARLTTGHLGHNVIHMKGRRLSDL